MPIIVDKENNFWKNFFKEEEESQLENGIFVELYQPRLSWKGKDPAPGRLNYTSQRPDAQISSLLGPFKPSNR